MEMRQNSRTTEKIQLHFTHNTRILILKDKKITHNHDYNQALTLSLPAYYCRHRGVARGRGANRPVRRAGGAPVKPTISTKLLFYRIPKFSLFLKKIIVN